MHCTNGIIIQRKARTFDTVPTIHVTNSTRLRKIRSFSPVTSELEPYYQPSERPAPQTICEIDLEANSLAGFLSRQADWIWIICRYKLSKEGNTQEVPSWTGFYHEVMTKNDDHPHSIHYLPSINQSPTKMDTVQEIIFQVKAKSEALGLQSADLVFDHAIYAKALEILCNPANKHLNDFINLRMGGFHACGIFIAVIGKRFSSAGLKDVIIETNVVGPGTIESLMKGKQYNRGVRVMKTVFEALQRLKLNAFEEWLHEKQKIQKLADFLESEEFSSLIQNRNNNNMKVTVEKFHVLFALINEFDDLI